MMVAMPSGEIRMKALGLRFGADGRCGVQARASSTGSMYAARSIPPPAMAVTRRKERRPMVLMVLVFFVLFGSTLSNVFIGPPQLRPVLRTLGYIASHYKPTPNTGTPEL